MGRSARYATNIDRPREGEVMPIDNNQSAESLQSREDHRWWAAAPLLVMVIAPLSVVFRESLGTVGVPSIIAVGVSESFAVRMAVRPRAS